MFYNHLEANKLFLKLCCLAIMFKVKSLDVLKELNTGSLNLFEMY